MSRLDAPPLGPLKPIAEKDVQRQVAALLAASGFTVRNTSQVRPSMVAVGIPDLILHHPRIRKAGWFEVKKYRVRGYDPRDESTWRLESMSLEQEMFRTEALACGQIHAWGGVRDAQKLLLDLGLAFYRSGMFTLRPHGPPPEERGTNGSHAEQKEGR